MKILFESDYFEPNYFSEWEDACKESNVEYKVVSREDWHDHFTLKNCFVGPIYAFGSIQFFQHLQDMKRKLVRNPVPWKIVNNVTWKNYECTSYYPHLGEYLLNGDYTMLPFGELERQKTKLFARYGNNDCIFIRPNEGTKPFAGTVMARNVTNWERSMKLLGFYDDQVGPDTLCVVSEPCNIQAEWRFLIVNGEVVTGSIYKNRVYPCGWNGSSRMDVFHSNVDSPGIYYNEKALNLAQEIAEKYQPDDMFTVDICEHMSEIRLLEINGFGCAGMYACDRHKILKSLLKYEKEIKND